MSDDPRPDVSAESLLSRGVGEITNSDMFVPEVLQREYSSFGPLLRNDLLEKFFGELDRRAKRYKFWFNCLGQVSLALIVVVLLLSTWRLVAEAGQIEWMKVPSWATGLSAVFGLTSVLLTAVIWLTRLKHKWIFGRYRVERVRQWKYQQLLDGAFVESLHGAVAGAGGNATIPKTPDPGDLYGQRLRLFLEEASDYGGLIAFLDTNDLKLPVVQSAYADKGVFDRMLRLYRSARLEGQINHFRRRDAELEGRDRWSDGLAKALLGAAVVVAVAEVLLLAFAGGEAGSPASHLLAGTAITLTILSAAVRVYRSATAISRERERYSSTASTLEIIKARIESEGDAQSKLGLMAAAEGVCLQELREFLKALRESEYYL